MSQARRRRRRRLNSSSSPLTITIDLRQFVTLVVGAFVGWLLGLGGLSRLQIPSHPIQIVPGAVPVTIEPEGKKPPPALPDKGSLEMGPSRLRASGAGQSGILLTIPSGS